MAQGPNLLHLAASGGELLHVDKGEGQKYFSGIVESLLTMDSGLISTRDPTGRTACDYAVEHVKRLEKQFGLEPYASDHEVLSRYTPDEQAQWHDANRVLNLIREEHAEALVRDAPPGMEITDGDGRTGLHLAARDGDEAQVRRWIAERGNLLAEDNEGDTPAALAAFNRHTSILRMLLQHSPGEYGTCDDARSLIVACVPSGSAEVMDVFLEERPDADLAQSILQQASTHETLARDHGDSEELQSAQALVKHARGWFDRLTSRTTPEAGAEASLGMG